MGDVLINCDKEQNLSITVLGRKRGAADQNDGERGIQRPRLDQQIPLAYQQTQRLLTESSTSTSTVPSLIRCSPDQIEEAFNTFKEALKDSPHKSLAKSYLSVLAAVSLGEIQNTHTQQDRRILEKSAWKDDSREWGWKLAALNNLRDKWEPISLRGFNEKVKERYQNNETSLIDACMTTPMVVALGHLALQGYSYETTIDITNYNMVTRITATDNTVSKLPVIMPIDVYRIFEQKMQLEDIVPITPEVAELNRLKFGEFGLLEADVSGVDAIRVGNTLSYHYL